MRTLLIDSEQLESDDALDTEFRNAAAAEIDQFKRELAEREGAAAAEKVTDKDLLLSYRETAIDAGYRLDLLVGGAVIVEVKAVEAMLPIHQAQIMTYLRLSGCRLGCLMNFNVAPFRDGTRQPTPLKPSASQRRRDRWRRP